MRSSGIALAATRSLVAATAGFLLAVPAVAAVHAQGATPGARPLSRSDLAGTDTKRKPFEEVCPGRMIGIAVRSSLTAPGSGAVKVFGMAVSMGQQVNTARVTAIAPICEGADGQALPLAWHGGKGDEGRFTLSPGEHIVAVSGTFAGRRGEQLGSFQVHAERRSSAMFGVPSVGDEEHILNELFIHRTPWQREAVGIYGRAGGDDLSAVGVVYAPAPWPQVITAMASDPAAPPIADADVQQAVERGVKMRGGTEGGTARNSMFSLTGTGFGLTLEGPLNLIANEASARAKRKQSYTVDSISKPIPAVLMITARPFDSDQAKLGKVVLDLDTDAPTAIEIVTKADGQDAVTKPVYSRVAYWETTNLGDEHGTNNPFVGRGFTAVFPITALPNGAFTVRVVTASKTFEIPVDDKARAKIR